MQSNETMPAFNSEWRRSEPKDSSNSKKPLMSNSLGTKKKVSTRRFRVFKKNSWRSDSSIYKKSKRFRCKQSLKSQKPSEKTTCNKRISRKSSYQAQLLVKFLTRTTICESSALTLNSSARNSKSKFTYSRAN